MLRKTAAKAFGLGDPERATVPPAPHETRRGEAIERLFRDFHLALEAGAAPGVGDADSSLRDEDGAWTAAGSLLRVTRPRSLAGGIELTLEGPAASFTFLNTLAGFIRAGRRASGVVEPVEILSVARHGGVFRPIRKLVVIEGAPPRAGVRRRTPFAFTSVAELARDYLDAAKSIHKVDTPRPVS